MTDLSQWVGRSQKSQDVITLGGVKRFYAALDIEVPADIVEKGIAPYGYHWCLCLPDSSMSELGVDGHPKKGGFLPPVELPRRMWAASDVEFFTALPIGAEITRRSQIASVKEKTGKTGVLVFVEVDHQTEFDGQCAIKERQTIVYRDAATSPAPLPEANAGVPNDWQVVQELLPSSAMLFRYSALTFNSHRIHYDLPYAQEQEMYPELVVHGPLMATLALQLAVANGNGGFELTKFSYRGVSPAFCNQPLYMAGNFEGKTGELAAIGADGRTCVTAKADYSC